MPVGFGARMGNDRDMDSFFNQDEIDASSDPADPASTPGGGALPVPGLGLWGVLLLGAVLALAAAYRRRRA